jgi:hypothetical protein
MKEKIKNNIVIFNNKVFQHIAKEISFGRLLWAALLIKPHRTNSLQKEIVIALERRIIDKIQIDPKYYHHSFLCQKIINSDEPLTQLELRTIRNLESHRKRYRAKQFATNRRIIKRFNLRRTSKSITA